MLIALGTPFTIIIYPLYLPHNIDDMKVFSDN